MKEKSLVDKANMAEVVYMSVLPEYHGHFSCIRQDILGEG